MREWPTYAYWRESHERVKRFWYVSFCLMMSAVQDRLTGLALREAGNLNWATTAFYYNTVHAGRIMCFVCCGDFPKGHLELASMLGGAATGNSPIKVNWLWEFRKYVGGALPIGPDDSARGTAASLHTRLREAIDADFPGNVMLVKRFREIPSLFRNLRNDCNYEALLVAHERNHFLVRQGFEDLVAAAEGASAIAVETATALYMTNLNTASCFDSQRPRYIDAHRTYVQGRLTACLAEKFQGSPAAMLELERVLEFLQVVDAAAELPPAHEVEAFLAPIMYDEFGEKRGLMERWNDDIHALSGAVGEHG